MSTVRVVVTVQRCGANSRITGHRITEAEPHVIAHLGELPFQNLVMELARDGYEVHITREVEEISILHWYGATPGVPA